MLINKDFVCHGIRVTIALPGSYDATKTYPAVFLNDGQLDYLGKLANSVILIGLEPKHRLDDFTPWYAQALRPGNPDFGGKLAAIMTNYLVMFSNASHRSSYWMKVVWLTEATH